MIKGVILDCDSLAPGDLDLTPITSLNIDWQVYPHSHPAETAKRIATAAVVLTNKVPLGEREIQAAPELQYIGVLATGTNIIDMAATQQRNIRVCNVAGYGSDSVVQHTFALILSLATRQADYQRAAVDGHWANSQHFCLLDYPIQQLSGRPLGIVGYGELGRGVAKIAEAFGMTVKIASLPGRHYHSDLAEEPTRIPLPELLPQVDILSLHCPLTPETENLIGPSELALMKPTALLINCARGGIVDETALANALRNGKLGGAGVDVLSEEPPRQGNPLLAADIPNLIVTPHCAWGSRRSRQNLVDLAGENLRAFLQDDRKA